MTINETESLFDLTPDPKVLIALTRTAMQPLDALCELIDNSIDSFSSAILKGRRIDNPIIVINLPRPKELAQNEGFVQIQDNGPGLTKSSAEKAIRAGYTGNNPYDTLGLFGMGFNISTGKLGRQTILKTWSEEEPQGVSVKINLEQIIKSGSYLIPFARIEKEDLGKTGTIIRINEWWPEGDPNSGFIKKLISYGLPTIRREIGRRYATLLRDITTRIIINDEPCVPFEHCVWHDSRFVTHRDHGNINAVLRFDQVINSSLRCGMCTSIIMPNSSNCPACGSSIQRTVEEKIRGWVGIQRFDHLSEFGIDLIRNGRAIRIAEKSAFFEYTDEFKNVLKDYPIDQTFGRIVGEVHLDHVPVDFSKQDFQRSSPEWAKAMSFLRGESSLQPNQPNANLNKSPLFKLYQGYRRVKTAGKKDMYMGYWDTDNKKPSRIDRDIEKDYYDKFLQKLPGYYDDLEWWKLVEAADTPPLPELVDCPICDAQNPQSSESCMVCGHILISKKCINPECFEDIPRSAISCPVCGMSQITTVLDPWTCLVCHNKNAADRSFCMICGLAKGIENTLSKEYLLGKSNKSDDLSIPGCSILLANGSYSQSIDVDTYITSHSISTNLQDKLIPMVTFKSDKIEIFIDKTHPIFKVYNQSPEQMIASEVALYIYDFNRSLAQPYQGQHTLANLQWEILNSRWALELEDSGERVKEDIRMFFTKIKLYLSDVLGDLAADYFDEMKDNQKKMLVDNLLDKGMDIGNMNELKESGRYLNYVDESTVVDIFNKWPARFFDNNIWNIHYNDIEHLPEGVVEQAQSRIFSTHYNCLQDIASVLRYTSSDMITRKRARLSLDFLQQKAVF